MIKKFWHVGVSVKDLDKSIAQYRKLGFKVVDRFEKPEPHALAAELEHSNGSGVELWQWLDEKHPQVEFIKSHIAFASDDIDNDVQTLVDQGCEIVIPKTKGIIVTYTFVRDPSGNYIEIAEIKD